MIAQRLASVQRRSTGILIMLMIEFVLGMITNLYVTVPSSHPGAGSGPYFSGAVTSVLWSLVSGIPALVLHVVMGILLLVAAVELLVRTVRVRHAAAIGLSTLALAGIILAGFNGASFLKYQLNISSMLMSVGFALAMGGCVCLQRLTG
ncbi:MAG: hypothetical protein WCB85_07580 [Candidatus Dormiibacterota bacterium]